MAWLVRISCLWRPFRFPLGLVALMGLIHALTSVGLGGTPEAWGNIPRTLEGLNGILTSHLRHDSWGHWLANAVPLVVLAGLSAALMPKATRQAWWILPVLDGALLWVVGRPAIHIGASALVYGWFFFLMGMALFHRSALAVAGMMVALALFGGLLWVFESGPGISWEGHVCGAVAGATTAWWVSKRGAFLRASFGLTRDDV